MIRRRLPETICLAAASIGLFAWSSQLYAGSFLWAIAAAFFAFALGAAAVIGPASAPCPLCGELNHDLWSLFAPDLARCPHCRRYYNASDAREAAVDHVSKAPFFSVPVNEGEALPALCCVCAAPSTRAQELVYRGEGRVSIASPTVIKTNIQIAVPYCAAHEGGAALVNEDLAPSVPFLEGGQRTTDHRWVLKVRSYGFYRAAMRLA